MSSDVFCVDLDYKLKDEGLVKYAVSRAESIQLLRGTAQAKMRTSSSVEASQTPRVFTPPVV